MNDGELGMGALVGFLRQKKALWIIVIALFIGIALMLVGDGGGAVSTERHLEARVEKLCERIQGVSDVHAMINVDKNNEVRGAAIVCSGGDSPTVRLKLTELISALFEIPSSSVSVVGGG